MVVVFVRCWIRKLCHLILYNTCVLIMCHKLDPHNQRLINLGELERISTSVSVLLDNSSNVGFVEFYFPMFALIFASLHYIIVHPDHLFFLFADIGCCCCFFSLKFIFYGILTCMSLFFKYNDRICSDSALTNHSNCSIHQCEGAAMKAKKTDKRAIFTHKIYCSKPHKRKKNEMKLQQHTKYHTQFKIQQSIKSVREQLVIEIYIKSCSMQNK